VFPGARVEVFPDSAHWPFVDNADKTRALVVPFLRPRLSARVARAEVGERRIRVRVRVAGMVPAYRVSVRLAGAQSAAATVSGVRTLVVRPGRALHAGRYRLTVHALGLPTRHLRLHVPPAEQG
jgi:hypothetical protein